MKVSIIGAGRNNNGVGEFIAKYFHKNKADVISVLGTTKTTAQNATDRLIKAYIDDIETELPIRKAQLSQLEFLQRQIKAQEDAKK